MTLDNFSKIATEGLRQEINKHIKYGLPMSNADAIDYQTRQLGRWWSSRFGRARTTTVNIEGSFERTSLPQLVKRLMPILEKNASTIMLDVNKKATIRNIVIAGARSQIEDILNPRHLKYEIIEQAYRIKLVIRLSNNSTLVLPMKYKTIQQDIEKLLPTICSAEQIIYDFGKDAKLY